MELRQQTKREFKPNQKLGTLRGDFVYGVLNVTWVENITLNEIQHKEIQEVINLVKQKFVSFQDVVNLCETPTFANGETNYFIESKNFHYWLHLNPISYDYCIHLYVYPIV